MDKGTRPSDIRKRILRQRGVELRKLSRKPIPIADLPAPYPKSVLMKLIELKFRDKLDNLIFTGTIYEAGRRLNIHPSTISKWRKLIEKAKEEEFFGQFR